MGSKWELVITDTNGLAQEKAVKAGQKVSVKAESTSGYRLIRKDKEIILPVDAAWNEAWIGTSSGNKPYIIGDSAISGSSRVVIHNGTEHAQANVQDLQPGSQYEVGGLAQAENYNFNGYVHEVIYYLRALNTSEKIVIQNYLSAKWGTDLASSIDFYTGDNLVKGDYDYNVTGILKQNSSNVISGKSSVLTIVSSASDGFLKDVGDAVFVGSKGEGVVTSELPSNTIATVRSNTVWHLDVTDTATKGGHIDLTFDLKKLGMGVSGDARDYVLFWRSGTSGQFYEIAGAEDVFDGSVFFANLQIDISASDSLIQTSESLIKDGYFTVGSKDIAAPEYHSVEISDNTISLCFDEYLDENSIPDASAFSIDINGARTITAVTVSGLKVLLTIDGDAITDADSITLNYTQPVDSPLANLSGHAIANLNNFLFGSAGDNTLVGTAGVDVIVGGMSLIHI